MSTYRKKGKEDEEEIERIHRKKMKVNRKKS